MKKNSIKNSEERLKIDLFFSYIPFISFLLYNKYKDYPVYRENTKITLFITIVLLLLSHF